MSRVVPSNVAIAPQDESRTKSVYFAVWSGVGDSKISTRLDVAAEVAVGAGFRISEVDIGGFEI